MNKKNLRILKLLDKGMSIDQVARKIGQGRERVVEAIETEHYKQEVK